MEKKEKRNEKIHITLTATEHKLLKSKSNEIGLSKSRFLLTSLYRELKVKNTDIENKKIAQLSWIGNNLNQISKKLNIANLNGTLETFDYKNLLDEIQNIKCYMKDIASS